MSGRVVPQKLTSYNALPVGVSNKQFEISYASMIPANSSSNTEFTPRGTSRLLFRVPAYQNTFLDNSRSTISFKFKADSDPSDAAANGYILNPSLGTTSIFKRMIIKSPNGLVIEHVDDLHVLNKILETMSSTHQSRHLEGILEGTTTKTTSLSTAEKEALKAKQKDGVRLQYMFNHGMLSRHLQSYLPLHSMNGGNQGMGFTIELFLNEGYNVLQKIGTGGASTTKSYGISDVKYNMTLLKADEAIISRFNNLANDSSEIVIPFSTYRSYTNSLASKKSSVQISEACSDLRSVHTVIRDGTATTEPQTTGFSSELTFLGGFENALQVEKYQLQVGSKFIYNEPIECEADNSDLLNQVINASFSKSDIKALRLSGTTGDMAYEDEDFTLTSTFCYNDSSQFTNGISLGSLPLVLRLDLVQTPDDKSLITFSELGYNLVIKEGYLSVRDSKSIEDFGY